jgi:hypothetical protein
MLARLARLVTRRHLLTPEQWEAEQNADSIRELPLAEFPYGPARHMAVERALAGEELYAYRPAHAEHWVLWHCRRPDDAGRDCRYTPAEWAAKEGYALTDHDGGAA